ncbi:hypothetical protein [Duganella sp. S19_KUP01_CR8]|uniref:hypothetical protein n=1 Tax=Duganella sp. S19_KUP01_CR8 TaxID=3025502 RepID=UPI002FCD9887
MSAGAPPASPALTAQLQTLRACGASYNKIAATLNRNGVPGLQGGRWFAASVRRALLQMQAKEST